MRDENQTIAESVRSGQYFEDAKDWYATSYIGPISERTFFLVIAVLAGIVGFCSFISLTALLPLVPKPAIVLSARDSSGEYVPRLIRLREQKGDPVEAIERFFVLQYLEAREGYVARNFSKSAAFVRAQSTGDVYAQYYAQQQENNPQSFVKIFGSEGTQFVAVNSLDIDHEDAPQSAVGAGSSPTAALHVAKLRFTTESALGNQSSKSQWTATLKYNYTMFAVKDEKDPTTGAIQTRIIDPKFQVISYVVTKDSR